MDRRSARRKARETAFCLIYQASFDGGDFEALYGGTHGMCAENTWEESGAGGFYINEADYKNPAHYAEDLKYVKGVFETARENGAAIEAFIAECSKGWKNERISRVSMAILRLAVCEMLYLPSVPVNIAINEAVGLAKKYDADGAPAFVNGVLGAIEKLYKPFVEKDEDRVDREGKAE